MWNLYPTLYLILIFLSFFFLCLLLVLLFLFGHGIDQNNVRRGYPHDSSYQKFLRTYVHNGMEESGLLERPRPHGELVRLFYRFWLPKECNTVNDIKAIVVVLQGINSHSGRSDKCMTEVLQRGFLVAGIDHEGMGRSDGRHGYFSSLSTLVDDAIAFIELVKAKYPRKKVFLFGMSMGGLMALHALSKGGSKLVDGAIILCPATEIHEASRPSHFMQTIGRILHVYMPKLPLVEGNRGINNSPEMMAIADAERKADRLYYFGKMRIGTGIALLEGIVSIQDKLHLIETPYLLQHGTADRVCKVTGSAALYLRTRSADKTFKTYEGGQHDLIHEPPHIRNAVIRDFVNWLEDHCKP